MKGFFDNLLGDHKKKQQSSSHNNNNNNNNGNSNNNNNNPFAQLTAGWNQKFQGSGQSLGGSKPGIVFPIALANPGSLGLRVEKRPNSQGTAIVASVIPGSQAETAGLQRGDVLCFAGSNGQEEIMYDLFLELAKSEQRPLQFEVRRIPPQTNTKAASANTTTIKDNPTHHSADALNRKQAMIAAAEARERAHKAKTKPTNPSNKTSLSLRNKPPTAEQLQLEQRRLEALKAQTVPMTEQAARAMEQAKANELRLANELGYNPYETNKATAGQARSATTAATHGSIQGGTTSTTTTTTTTTARANDTAIPTVAPPRDPTSTTTNTTTTTNYSTTSSIPVSEEFEDAYTTLATTTTAETTSTISILIKLITNATTKGQSEDGSKFRKIKLSNPKIASAIVTVPGAMDVLLSTGFTLAEQEGESVLLYPYRQDLEDDEERENCPPKWISTAIQHLEGLLPTTDSSSN